MLMISLDDVDDFEIFRHDLAPQRTGTSLMLTPTLISSLLILRQKLGLDTIRSC